MDVNILSYVKPELLVVIFVLWGLGLMIKASKIENRFIPIWLCMISLAVALIWVYATTEITTSQQLAMAIFTAIVQGVIIWLIAWLTYDKFIKSGLSLNNSGKG